MAQLKPMLLIMIALIVLVLPGIIFNNLSASGYVQSGEPGLSCPGYPDVTCQGSVAVGCQAVASSCTLSGASISFLNQNSPYTSLFTGNILGFITGLFNTVTANSNGYTGVTVFRNCMNPQNQTGNALNIFVCTDSGLEGLTFNPTYPSFLLIGSGNSSAFNAYSFSCPPATSHFCGSNVAGNGNTVLPMEFTKYHILSANTYNASTPYTGYYNNCAIHLVSECTAGGGAHWINSTTGMTTTYLAYVFYVSIPQTSQQTGASIALPGFWSFLGFVFGILLLVMGLGLQLSGSLQALASGVAASVGTNVQGTRLAQVVGLFLLGWSALYSEFSTWFTSGVLPYGLDGSLGIVSILLSSLGFFGVFWLSLSWGEG